MHDNILRQIQQSVQAGNYVMTVHAEEEMNADALTIFDVEAAILSGTITEQQRDHQTGESKYLITGVDTTGIAVEVVAKLRAGSWVVILTVYVV